MAGLMNRLLQVVEKERVIMRPRPKSSATDMSCHFRRARDSFSFFHGQGSEHL
jgi:hypothetical protein